MSRIEGRWARRTRRRTCSRRSEAARLRVTPRAERQPRARAGAPWTAAGKRCRPPASLRSTDRSNSSPRERNCPRCHTRTSAQAPLRCKARAWRGHPKQGARRSRVVGAVGTEGTPYEGRARPDRPQTLLQCGPYRQNAATCLVGGEERVNDSCVPWRWKAPSR